MAAPSRLRFAPHFTSSIGPYPTLPPVPTLPSEAPLTIVAPSSTRRSRPARQGRPVMPPQAVVTSPVPGTRRGRRAGGGSSTQPVLVGPAKPARLWVPRPPLSVGYSMPLARGRKALAWGYTLPSQVRGAFMRTLNGIFMRGGGSRVCWRALHKFCSGPRQVIVRPGQGGYSAGAAPRAPRTPLRAQLKQKNARSGIRRRLSPPRPAAPRRPSSLRTPCLATYPAWGQLGHSTPLSPHLDMWEQLQAQPHMAYGLKYCRLSRRVRKILRNRYRYSKYFFMVPPAKRLAVTLHL